MWKKFDTIQALPQGLWDEKIAGGDVALESRLIRVAERIFPEARFEYWLCETDGMPSALIFWMIENEKASTGTPETSGRHFWFDDRIFGREAFPDATPGEVPKGVPDKIPDEIQPDAKTLIFRDFSKDEAEIWAPVLENHGFRPEPALELSTLTIPERIGSLEEYPSVLNAKQRYDWNRCRAALDRDLYTVETVSDYLPILDQLYPLYVEVSERAREYTAPPYPKAYFRIVREEFGDDAAAVTIREKKTGEYLGFMLLLYGQGSCVHQYIGFHRRDDLFLWHNLTIESIGDAIGRGVRRINMGVTHAAAKRKLGAVSQKMCTFTKNPNDENR